MLIVSVSITVSVHASVSASVSVSVLVTVYCYFRHPGALPPPSPQLLQLPFCSVISGTRSLSNPLSPGAEKCYPEGVAQPSIAVVVLPLACVEVRSRRIRSHPCDVRGLQAEEHRGVRAASLDGKRRWNSQQAQKALHRIFWNSSRYRCSRSWCPCCRAR